MLALERNPEVPASTPDEDLGLGSDCRGISRDPRNSHEEWTFLKPQEWIPDDPIVTEEEPQVCCHNSRKTRRFSPQHKMRPFSAVASREKSHIPSCVSIGSLTPLRQFKKFPDIPVFTREENRGSHHNSRRAPFFPLILR